jgi:Type II secretory pathway, component PulK
MVSIEELKSIPAVKKIDWSIMQKNFCALPEANQISININTLNINDDYLLSSLFPNISLQEAKYILDNIPDSGFDDLINFKNNFPDMNFEDAYGEIKFNSNIYEINTEINF